jgi:hypothetical protein
MFNLFSRAKEGDFIKDLGAKQRSLGLVERIDHDTNMMLVKFPKINGTQWVMWNNYGHYKVV